ncbi:MAG TPA: sigma-54 dependent transcriptional regulator [Vicinamibacterales bacterium]|jgi:DNA-binding NtrC family response regulator
MAHGGSILVVDDEEPMVRMLGLALREEGHDVVETTSPRHAKRLLLERQFDVFVVDNIMPEFTGLDLIKDLVQSVPDAERPQILLMTGQPTIEGAIDAVKSGVLDYLQKPFDIEHLLAMAAHALEVREMRAQNRLLLAERDEEFDNYGMVGRSRAIREVLACVRMVAASKSTVLITGETGTGKECVARAIHAQSLQRVRPLIKVNCAAIPDNLLESELFGYVRGAFTGAMTSKRGKFALADRSSIFLDEIGTMSPLLQPKILRVLQEREFEPLGSERSEQVDVRLIAATNRDLTRMVAEGQFLEDLYYRLNVIPLHIPPLRERPEDIPILVEHFLRKHATHVGRPIERVEDRALELLCRHKWPGNVRELENMVERALVLSTGPVLLASGLSSLGVAAPAQAPSLPSARLTDNVAWAERETIRQALIATHGMKKHAADMVGISPRALTYYLGKHKLLDA